MQSLVSPAEGKQRKLCMVTMALSFTPNLFSMLVWPKQHRRTGRGQVMRSRLSYYTPFKSFMSGDPQQQLRNGESYLITSNLQSRVNIKLLIKMNGGHSALKQFWRESHSNLCQHDSCLCHIQGGSDGSCRSTCHGTTQCTLPRFKGKTLQSTPCRLNKSHHRPLVNWLLHHIMLSDIFLTLRNSQSGYWMNENGTSLAIVEK